LGTLLAAYPLALLCLAAAVAVLAPRSGVLALGAILIEHLVLAGLVLVPVAIILRHRLLGGTLLVLIAFAAVRFGPSWVSLPASADGRAVLSVATWNPLSAGTSPSGVVAAVLATEADIVALQELTPAVADALQADPRINQRYPHQELAPDATVLGMGLLSAFRISDARSLEEAPSQVARVELRAGSLVVINAHPLPGHIRGIAGLPVAFDGARRDPGILAVRAEIDRAQEAGDQLLVVGDYNVTPTEPMQATLAAGLRDAHSEAGSGLGWTWRPLGIAGSGLGVLRIDYVLVSPQMEPIATSLDCRVPSDHCLLLATIALPAGD
jgi:vancomycin resistance protein VanJ